MTQPSLGRWPALALPPMFAAPGATPRRAWRAMQATGRGVGLALMDQAVLAGAGRLRRPKVARNRRPCPFCLPFSYNVLVPPEAQHEKKQGNMFSPAFYFATVL